MIVKGMSNATYFFTIFPGALCLMGLGVLPQDWSYSINYKRLGQIAGITALTLLIGFGYFPSQSLALISATMWVLGGVGTLAALWVLGSALFVLGISAFNDAKTWYAERGERLEAVPGLDPAAKKPEYVPASGPVIAPASVTAASEPAKASVLGVTAGAEATTPASTVVTGDVAPVGDVQDKALAAEPVRPSRCCVM